MPSACMSPSGTGEFVEMQNPLYLVEALVQRQVSGPGMTPGTWTYTYEPVKASVERNCPSNSCQSNSYTDVVAPDGVRSRYFHSTRHGALQGKLLRTEVYSGTTLKRATDLYYNFVESDRPYPGAFGDAMTAASPSYGSENLIVVRKSVTSQQGRTFTWEVPYEPACSSGLNGFCLDSFARPTKVVKSSTP